MIEQSEDTTNIEVKIKEGYVYWFGLIDSYRRNMPSGHWIEHPDNEVRKIDTGHSWGYGDWHISNKEVDTSLFTVNSRQLITHVYSLVDLKDVKTNHKLVDVSQLNGLPNTIRGTDAYKRLMSEIGFSYVDYEWIPFTLYESEPIYETITSPVIGQWQKMDLDVEIAECKPNFDYRVSMPDAILWGKEYYWAMPCIFLNRSDSYTEYLAKKIRQTTKHKVYAWNSRPNSNYSNELNVSFPHPVGSKTFRIPHGMKCSSLHELINKIEEWEDEVIAAIKRIEQDGCFDSEQIEKWINSFGLDRDHVALKMREWLDEQNETS